MPHVIVSSGRALRADRAECRSAWRRSSRSFRWSRAPIFSIPGSGRIPKASGCRPSSARPTPCRRATTRLLTPAIVEPLRLDDEGQRFSRWWNGAKRIASTSDPGRSQ